MLFADDEPGRPASRALAQAKLAEIDSQMALWPGPARSSSGDGLHLPVDRRL